MVRLMRHLSTSLVLGTMLLGVLRVENAQAQSDTLPAPKPAAPPAAALQPPISPRRALLYSFVLPGYGQARLGRHKAAATFLLVEAISLAMIRESAADVREARRFDNDTAVVSYINADGDADSVLAAPRFNDAFVHTRRDHVEDWIALLVGNHLFAGADAFVAAHLWDVPARIGLRVLPRSGGATVSAAFRW